MFANVLAVCVHLCAAHRDDRKPRVALYRYFVRDFLSSVVQYDDVMSAWRPGAWMTGAAIDAFLMWLVEYEVPAYAGVQGDKASSHAAEKGMVCGHTVYLPTHFAAYIQASKKSQGLSIYSLIQAPRLQAPGYLQALEEAEHLLMIWNVSKVCASSSNIPMTHSCLNLSSLRCTGLA
jgi:hypothetical protein